MQQSADQRLPIAIAMPVPVLFQNGNGPGWWQGQGQPRTHEFHTVLPAVQAASSARPGGARVVETEAMIAAADLDGDGKVSYKEFETLDTAH